MAIELLKVKSKRKSHPSKTFTFRCYCFSSSFKPLPSEYEIFRFSNASISDAQSKDECGACWVHPQGCVTYVLLADVSVGRWHAAVWKSYSADR